jgi:hypothetical protein
MGTTAQNLQGEIDQCVQELHNWCDTWIQLWTAPLECLTSPAGEADETYSSPDFTVGSFDKPRSLALAGPLTWYFGTLVPSVALPVNLVHFSPPSLGAGQTTFRLEVAASDVSSYPAGVYRGTANVGSPGPGLFVLGSASVPVWIVIP